MVSVTGEGGWRGTLYPGPTANEETKEGAVAALADSRVVIRPEDGGTPLLVPADLLVRQGDGSYFVPLSREEAQRFVTETETTVAAAPATRAADTTGEALVVPIIEEELEVGKRTVETGKVRITKTVQERQEVIHEALRRDEVTVERVVVGRPVEGPVDFRYDGDTMIIPLVEEVLVVEKRLVLKEELHITRRSTVTEQPQTVTIRREEAHVERVPVGANANGGGETKTE
jgi:uncharacterized protein (TIGR02271 family)